MVPVISLWQPWGSLWASGRKNNETRHWSTRHRGLILIHAAKHIEFDIDPVLREIVEDEFGGHWAMDLPRGAIVGCCELIGCASTDTLQVSEDEYACGNYGPGRVAWRAVNHTLFKRPVAARGQQTIFCVPRSLVADQLPVPA
jgi:hypothetical protein